MSEFQPRIVDIEAALTNLMLIVRRIASGEIELTAKGARWIETQVFETKCSFDELMNAVDRRLVESTETLKYAERLIGELAGADARRRDALPAGVVPIVERERDPAEVTIVRTSASPNIPSADIVPIGIHHRRPHLIEGDRP